jgi:hypothetical protein
MLLVIKLEIVNLKLMRSEKKALKFFPTHTHTQTATTHCQVVLRPADANIGRLLFEGGGGQKHLTPVYHRLALVLRDGIEEKTMNVSLRNYFQAFNGKYRDITQPDL